MRMVKYDRAANERNAVSALKVGGRVWPSNMKISGFQCCSHPKIASSTSSVSDFFYKPFYQFR